MPLRDYFHYQHLSQQGVNTGIPGDVLDLNNDIAMRLHCNYVCIWKINYRKNTSVIYTPGYQVDQMQKVNYSTDHL